MRPLPVRTRLGYGAGALATGAFSTVPGLLLLPYLTDTVAVPAATAGAIVLVPKIWDVLFNPVAGRISDAGLTARGNRRRGLLIGGLALAVCFAALFAHPGFDSVTADSAYVVVVFFACATAFAFFQVPYNALPAELTTGYDERTRLTSWRISLLALAILASGAGAPAIANAIGGVDGYRVMGVAVAALIVAGTIGLHFGISRVPPTTARPATPSFRELLSAMRAWRSFRWLLTVYVVQSLGIGTLLAGVNYLARYVLGDAQFQTMLFAGFVGPALLVMPLWTRFGVVRGKLTGFRVSSGLFGAALIGLVFTQVLPLAAVLAFVALAGVGYAGVQVFPLAILPDLIAAEEERTGTTRAGATAGVWTAAETVGLALGPGLFGLVLAAGGYVSTSDSSVVQPDEAITAIVFGVSAIPAVLVLLGMVLLRSTLLGPGVTGVPGRNAREGKA